MSLKVLQVPLQGSTRAIRLRAVREAWTGPFGSRDMGFLHSLPEDDSDPNRSAGRVKWGAVFGLALSVTVSTGFWAGVGLLVRHFLR
jgi:hypothetical protein